MMMEDLKIEVNRTERVKTASVEVYPDKRVVVSVPSGFSDAKVKSLLARKKNWISEKLREISTVQAPRRNREFVSGESFPLFGKELRLKIIQSNTIAVTTKDGRLFVSVPKDLDAEEQSELVKDAITKWYKKQALEKLKERSSYYAKRLCLEVGSVRIKDYGSRWGTCSPSGDLIFNWKLALTPSSIIDYVVVHELCHLEIPEHGSRFWRLVASVLPQYKKSKDWLKFMDYKNELNF